MDFAQAMNIERLSEAHQTFEASRIMPFKSRTSKVDDPKSPKSSIKTQAGSSKAPSMIQNERSAFTSRMQAVRKEIQEQYTTTEDIARIQEKEMYKQAADLELNVVRLALRNTHGKLYGQQTQ
jgi:hypothetical protein